MDEQLAMTNKKFLALVKATFILLTSLKNPIPLLPAARTHEKITMLASRPWNASTLLTSTNRSYPAPRLLEKVRRSSAAC